MHGPLTSRPPTIQAARAAPNHSSRLAVVGSGELVLRSVGWFPGDAWLGYRADQGTLRQVAAFRPHGIPGFLYWKLLKPIHRMAFDRMARHRVRPASG